MQTITGIARQTGANAPAPLIEMNIQERISKRLAGNIVAFVSTDVNGAFSFQIQPGSYFLTYGADLVPFRVRETSGTTTIDKLVEAL